MDLAQLAADLADLVAEAGERAGALAMAELRPLIVNAWGQATRPMEALAAAGADDTALRSISSKWKVPEELRGLLVDLYGQGNLHGTIGFFGHLGDAPAEVVDALGGPVYDAAAQAWMRQATNRLANIGDQAWAAAQTEIHRLMGTGAGREETKKALEHVLGVSEFRADTIARTELGAAANAGVAHAGDTLAAAGFRVEKEWFAQLDGRTRPSHVAADGQRVPLNGFFTVGGVEMSRPMDPGAPADEVVNCRCTMLIVEAPAVEVVGQGGTTTSTGGTVDRDAERRAKDAARMREKRARQRDAKAGGQTETAAERGAIRRAELKAKAAEAKAKRLAALPPAPAKDWAVFNAPRTTHRKGLWSEPHVKDHKVLMVRGMPGDNDVAAMPYAFVSKHRGVTILSEVSQSEYEHMAARLEAGGIEDRLFQSAVTQWTRTTRAEIDDLMEAVGEDKVSARLKQITLSKQANPADAYWSKRYGRPVQSAASGGARNMTAYRSEMNPGTFRHEYGHLADPNLNNEPGQGSKSAAWKKAMLADAEHVKGLDFLVDTRLPGHAMTAGNRNGISTYGQAHVYEDWAEAVRFYLHPGPLGSFRKPDGFMDVATFKDLFPNRWRLFQAVAGLP